MAQPAHGGLGQRQLPSQETLLRHPRQAFGITTGRAGLRQHRVITGHLAVQGQPALDPPHARHKEQERLHHLLRQVRPIIPAAQMFKLMQQ